MILKDPKLKLILIVVGIAIACITCAGLYSAYLISSRIWEDPKDYKDDVVDVYDMEVDHDMGIAGKDYENKPVYTDDRYYADMVNIIKNVKVKRYDLVVDFVEDILAKYQFNDDKLQTLSTLTGIYVLGDNYESVQEERIMFVSSIKDPELYITLFLSLSFQDQQMLITYSGVNILPSFNYDEITYEKKTSTPHSYAYGIIGSKEYYEVTLVYKGTKYYVYLIDKGGLQIFYVNNETHNMKSNTY
jgi:hypothetical protein